MSSDIDILETNDTGISLEVHAKSVGIRVSDTDENAIIFFDMTNVDHRAGLKQMIEVLQHQLDIWSSPIKAFTAEMDDEIIRMLKAQVDASVLICPDCGAKTQSTYLTPPDYNKFLIGCTKCEWRKLLLL